MMLKQLFLAVIVSYLVFRLQLLLRGLDLTRTVYNHSPGACWHVDGIDVGSEDMEELSNGLLLITSGLLVNGMDKSAPAYQGRKGSIKLFDFAHPKKAETVTLEGGDGFDPETLNPHGISSWHDVKSGRIYVFVINHLPGQREAVERFEFDKTRRVLKHLETFPPTKDVYQWNTPYGYCFSLNDLVAVGPRSFYFTNYQYFIQQPYAFVELLVGLPWAGVGYYDGETGTTALVHTGMLLANGINKSPDGRFIYVSHIGQREILVFQRLENNSLTKLQEYKLYTQPDNLWVSQDGKFMWTGAHPITWQVLQHIKDGTSIAPSQVLRMTLKGGLINSMQEVFADDGHLLSGSSIAIYRNGRMVIGTVSNKALCCDVKYL